MDPVWVIKIALLSGLVFVGLGVWLYRLVVMGQCNCACAPSCHCNCACAADCKCNKRIHVNMGRGNPYDVISPP